MLRKRKHMPLMIAVLVAACATGWLSSTLAAPPAPARVDYNFPIRPILADRCYACHGPDEKKRQAELRLDTAEGIRESGVIEPGQPEESEVYLRIAATDETHMPPRKSNLSLSPAEVALIRRWI